MPSITSSDTTTLLHRAKMFYGPLALWLVMLVAGTWAITTYEFHSEQPTEVGFATRWPEGSAIARPADRPALLLFVHPKCPCTRATLGEIERLFTSIEGRCDSAPETIVVVTVPEHSDPRWPDTDTVKRAAQLPSARIFVDEGGKESARFGAISSGAVMLFDPSRDCRYAGGVTLSRACEGDNEGRTALERILTGNRESAKGLPVFGCRLCLPEQPAD